MIMKFIRKKPLSSAEIQSALLQEAREYGIDRQSLTTSMGGMETDNTSLYAAVRAERAFRRSGWSFWLSVIALLISAIALVAQLACNWK